MSIQELLLEELDQLSVNQGVCRIVDKTGCVYPLGADTKASCTILTWSAVLPSMPLPSASAMRSLKPPSRTTSCSVLACGAS